MDAVQNAGRSWSGDLSIVDAEDMKQIHHLKLILEDPDQKEVEILKRNIECVVPCRTGEISNEGQRLSTSCVRSGARLQAIFSTNFLRKKKP